MLSRLITWWRSRKSDDQSTHGAASLHLWNGRYFVYPHFVRGPLSIASPPVTSVAVDAGDSDLGSAITRALHASTRLRREPDPAATAALLQELGCRSWLTLERESRCLSIAATDAGISLTPMERFEDRSEAEHGLRGERSTVLAGNSSPAQVGAMARACLVPL